MNLFVPAILFAAAAAGFLVAVVAVSILLLRPWMQCFMSNAPVTFPEILAMRLRRSPVQKICEQRIKVSYVGVDLSSRKLEQAYLQGADIEKLVDALCLAQRSGQTLSWDDLLRTELDEHPKD